METAVVVPTIREDCAKRFLCEWRDELSDARIIMIEDNPSITFELDRCEHYCWADIDRDLGADAWIIPRRTSAIRSYGIWVAWRDGADIIWSLDDDCYPEDDRHGYLRTIITRLCRTEPDDAWHDTIPDVGIYPRGYPYGLRYHPKLVVAHHGLWSEHADLDGQTQKANPDFRLPPAEGFERIPTGRFFPMCVMNLAWRRDLTPAMYMLLMGRNQAGVRWGFDRFDDIWAGLFVKKICDHLGWAVTSGSPSIRHSKASNPDTNIALEAAGIKAHETLWRHIAATELTDTTVVGCYRQLAKSVTHFTSGNDNSYWRRLGEAMTIWAQLFE